MSGEAARGRRGEPINTHSYGGYSRGCRCDVCRAAKAAYVRERRAAARLMAQRYTRSSTGNRGARTTARAPGATRYVAPLDRHGTRFGYEEHGCRCFDCTTARTASDAKYLKRGKAS